MLGFVAYGSEGDRIPSPDCSIAGQTCPQRIQQWGVAASIKVCGASDSQQAPQAGSTMSTGTSVIVCACH